VTFVIFKANCKLNHMHNFLLPTQLFNEKKVEVFFNEKQKRIIEDTKSYSEALINEIDFDVEAENILEHSGFNTPKLIKEKTTTGISTLILSGDQLPPGTPFQYGKKYEVEVADYRVPFVGNAEYFKIYPDKFNNTNLSSVLNKNSLVFKLTDYGKISGNDLVIESLRQEFLLNIETTERILSQIEEELSFYLPSLKIGIIESLKNRKQLLDSKKDSINKLNPFK